MWSKISGFFLPEHCVICGRAGASLCAGCLSAVEPENCCLSCGRLLLSGEFSCPDCVAPWDYSVALGFRDQTVGRLAETLKFAPRRGLARPLSLLLARQLYPLVAEAPSVVFLAVPTSRRHRAERGFDHAALVARALGQIFSASALPLLCRTTEAAQVGASRAERQAQAAFTVTARLAPLSPEPLYIVYDDITTTGATLLAAARALKQAGAQRVAVVVLAKSR